MKGPASGPGSRSGSKSHTGLCALFGDLHVVGPGLPTGVQIKEGEAECIGGLPDAASSPFQLGDPASEAEIRLNNLVHRTARTGSPSDSLARMIKIKE